MDIISKKKKQNNINCNDYEMKYNKNAMILSPKMEINWGSMWNNLNNTTIVNNNNNNEIDPRKSPKEYWVAVISYVQIQFVQGYQW